MQRRLSSRRAGLQTRTSLIFERSPCRLGRCGLCVEADPRNEKVSYKVREHSLAKVPVMLVAGRKEATERHVSTRRLGRDCRW